jgi:hypothetical protein
VSRGLERRTLVDDPHLDAAFEQRPLQQILDQAYALR